jgi:hypothetical protein
MAFFNSNLPFTLFKRLKLKTMRTFLSFFLCILIASITFGQEKNNPPQTQIMTLGVFHFAYPNLDAVKTDEKDQISVLDEPYQSEILAIAKALKEFNPTIIAVESMPDRQMIQDSLLGLYKQGLWALRRNEIQQLGFRLAKDLDLEKVWCVDDLGRHYPNIEEIFNDRARLEKFEQFYIENQASEYLPPLPDTRISSIIDAVYGMNRPEYFRERLSVYLLHLFKYEEQEGDFTGVDFETGRWYNRNLRIFRNIQRIPQSHNDRILLIVGSEHLNLLNIFFDVSREYDLISPLPYLENAKQIFPGIN